MHDSIKEPKSLKDFYIVAARRAHIPDIYADADTPLILISVEIDGEVNCIADAVKERALGHAEIHGEDARIAL